MIRGPEGTWLDLPASPSPESSKCRSNALIGSKCALPPGPPPRNSTRGHAASLGAAPKGRSAHPHADSRAAPRLPPRTRHELALNSEGRHVWKPVFCITTLASFARDLTRQITSAVHPAALVYKIGTNVSRRQGIKGNGLGVWESPWEDGPGKRIPETGALVLGNRAEAGVCHHKKLWV